MEAFLETEGQKPFLIYRILKLVIPLSVGVIGGATVLLAKLSGVGLGNLVGGMVATVVLSAACWTVFHKLDIAIPESSRRLRRSAYKLLQRYLGLGNVVGVEPALDPGVGAVLDEAAAIIQKHTSAPVSATPTLVTDAQSRAVQALETGVAKLLELAEPQSAQVQKQALAAGWVGPLLQEIRELDRSLDEHARVAATESAMRGDDAVARLRDARLGLQKIDSAIEELDDHLKS